MSRSMKSKKKKPEFDNKARIVQYVINRAKGMNKSKAALDAGYADGNHTGLIESRQAYKEIVKTYFKDKLLEQTTLEELGSELLKNVRQDQDRGAKNKAIEIALSKIEPEEHIEEEDDKVMVILRPTIEAEAKFIENEPGTEKNNK